MKALILVALAVFSLFALLACSPETLGPAHYNDHPCGFDKDNPAIVLYCTNSPTPSPSPTSNPNASVTPLANDVGQWAGKLGTRTTQIRKAHDVALSANADYASDTGKLRTFADTFRGDIGQPVSGIDGLSPPPAGLETQYDSLRTAAHALTVVLANPVSAQAVDAAYDTYVSGCNGVQDYFDADSIDTDLNCTGDIAALSPADFFTAVAPIISTMHTSADNAQSTFDALSPTQQADGIAVTSYGGGVGNAYGKAAQSVGVLTSPAELASLQQSFDDAANAVFDAGQQVENDVKSMTDPAGFAAEVTSAKSTLATLRAAVEVACEQLQTAASSAGVGTDLGCRS
jgi:hypothetical protein